MAVQTEEQAQIAADANNVTLTGAGIVDQEFKVFESFTQNLDSNWLVANVPGTHDVKFNAATFEELVSFGRVSNATLQATGVGTNYVAAFDVNAALDPVLGPYLGL